jgi:polar amino acid transport system substrate-binding protein
MNPLSWFGVDGDRRLQVLWEDGERAARKALACLLIVLAFLVMTVSAPHADTLVLAAANTWPTAYLVDGRPTGMLVDLVTEAYRRTGQSVDIKLMPWARCLKDAETGDVDGVFSSFKLPERERFLAFSKQALTTQVIVFFARPDWTGGFDGDLAAVRDVKIGVIAGTSYGEQFDAAVRDGVLRNVEPTNSIESNLKKLVFGRVDLVPSYRSVAVDTARRLQLLAQIREISPPLASVPTYLAFTKVRDLRKPSEDFDAAMASMKQDGTYDRIVGKYLR